MNRFQSVKMQKKRSSTEEPLMVSCIHVHVHAQYVVINVCTYVLTYVCKTHASIRKVRLILQ